MFSFFVIITIIFVFFFWLSFIIAKNTIFIFFWWLENTLENDEWVIFFFFFKERKNNNIIIRINEIKFQEVVCNYSDIESWEILFIIFFSFFLSVNIRANFIGFNIYCHLKSNHDIIIGITQMRIKKEKKKDLYFVSQFWAQQF